MTGRIIAVAGLCGAGKTTAVEYMAAATGGQVIYFGATVLKAVKDQGLPLNSQSEQKVRLDLRREHGLAYLAVSEGERIKALLSSGTDVFIDAVYVVDEFEYLSELLPSLDAQLIAIDATFQTRMARLQSRKERPLRESEIRERDAVERQKLKTGNVFALARNIKNDGSLGEFYGALNELL